MTTYIALLRAVNVGGNNKAPMAALRDVLTGLGFDSPRTLLQSGNAVFAGPAQKTAGLETRLEKAISEGLGVNCDVFVRTAKEWEQVVASNPMPQEAAEHPGRFLVTCLRQAPPAGGLEALRAFIQGTEIVELAGRELYVYFPVDIGNSKLTNVVIEKRLGVRGTSRNWNTVQKLAAMT